MILVNDPGTWAHIYWPLEHAPWHGWTPTDLIFPFFLFIIGVSMVLSFAKRLDGGASGEAGGESGAKWSARGGPTSLALHVLRRSVIIFAIGMFLHGFPYFQLSRIRIPGVLQRIAVCYLFAGFIVLMAGLGAGRRADGSERAGRGVAAVAATIVVLLVGYWALMMFVPVPEFGVGRLDPEGNLGAYLDRRVMGGHLWSQTKTWDPEGILSTLPAIATTLIGALVGEWLRSKRAPQLKCAGLLAAGAAGLVLGRLLHPFFPINKNLWTSTYVIFTGGFAMILLALIYWVVDIKGYRRWAVPFMVFGMNSIAAFTLSTWLAKCSIVFKVTRADGPYGIGADRVVTWHGYVYERFFAPLASPVNASLLFAVSYVLLWLGLMWLLYRKRIFVKI